MTTDFFKEVLFNDGEGTTQTDLNDLQKYLKSLINDGFFASLTPNLNFSATTRDPEFLSQNAAGSGFSWGAIATTRAFTLSPGQAFLRQGSANNKVQISAGTLFQLTNATITGDDPVFLPYRFTGNEEFTLTVGDATNPRVDLLQAKIEVISTDSQSRDFEDATTRIVTSTAMNCKRRIQCTLSVKAGTPGASPTVPEPDAGYVVVGSVMVGNTYAIATAPIFGIDTAAVGAAVVHDQRLPLRVKAYTVDPTLFKLVTAEALSNSNSSVTSSNAVNDMYVPCPAGLGRLVGVGIYKGTIQNTATQTLGGSTSLTSTSFTARNTLAPTANAGIENFNFWTFEATHAPSAGPTIVPSVTSKIGVPVWSNGLRCPREEIFTGNNSLSRLVLRLQTGSNASVVGQVVFFVAEGI